MASMKNKINTLYAKWYRSRSSDDMNSLLAEVRARVVHRFERDETHNAEDIAQIVLIKVWRSLPGQKKGIKSFNKARGDFASYCATVALSAQRDFHKHDRLVPMEDKVLVQMIEDTGDKNFLSPSYSG